MTEKSYARSINLPNEQIFRNLNNARCLALDIGKCEQYVHFCQSQHILLHSTAVLTSVRSDMI